MNTIELLNKQLILNQLKAGVIAQIDSLIILETVGSTNNYLLQQNNLPSGYIVLAEQQTAGRGRRDGRGWVSPFGKNIHLSIGWRFPDATQLTGLSLAIGVAVADALQAYGLDGIQVKWPNDIVYRDQKLGGILIETSKTNAGDCQVIIGIGINVAMPADSGQQIEQVWTDIQTIIGQTPGRNLIVSHLLNASLPALQRFQTEGLAAFKTRWQQLDALAGRAVTVFATQSSNQEGIAQGIDDAGFLIVEINGTPYRLSSGEVSVRPRQKN